MLVPAQPVWREFGRIKREIPIAALFCSRLLSATARKWKLMLNSLKSPTIIDMLPNRHTLVFTLSKEINVE